MEFVELVYKMRVHQRAWLEKKNYVDFNIAQSLAERVDEEIESIKRSRAQPRLPGMEE